MPPRILPLGSRFFFLHLPSGYFPLCINQGVDAENEPQIGLMRETWAEDCIAWLSILAPVVVSALVNVQTIGDKLLAVRVGRHLIANTVIELVCITGACFPPNRPASETFLIGYSSRICGSCRKRSYQPRAGMM